MAGILKQAGNPVHVTFEVGDRRRLVRHLLQTTDEVPHQIAEGRLGLAGQGAELAPKRNDIGAKVRQIVLGEKITARSENADELVELPFERDQALFGRSGIALRDFLLQSVEALGRRNHLVKLPLQQLEAILRQRTNCGVDPIEQLVQARRINAATLEQLKAADDCLHMSVQAALVAGPARQRGKALLDRAKLTGERLHLAARQLLSLLAHLPPKLIQAPTEAFHFAAGAGDILRVNRVGKRLDPRGEALKQGVGGSVVLGVERRSE